MFLTLTTISPTQTDKATDLSPSHCRELVLAAAATISEQLEHTRVHEDPTGRGRLHIAMFIQADTQADADVVGYLIGNRVCTLVNGWATAPFGKTVALNSAIRKA